MTAVQQFAEIGADRRSLRLEKPLPENIPCGKARVEIRFIVLPEPEPPHVSAHAAAWREFLDALDKIDGEPLGELPPRIGNWGKILAEYEAMPPLVCDDMPPRLSLRELPL
ncbi:MAG: hypothetical protein LBR23_00600 [Spirochaetaceae bacterium]|jgi:hypothetical protein|nr:hypothetical protein [Spirochaetaceae bacterium]